MRKVASLIVGALVFASLAVIPATAAVASELVDCAADNVGVIVIRGTIGMDTLIGTSDDEIFCAGDGNDKITTGGGNDTVYGGNGIDYIDGVPEDCIAPYAPGAILGTSGNDSNLRGTEGPDIICAFGGDDVIFGLGGNDIIYAGDGNDSVQGGFGDDYIDFGAGTDTGFGGPGGDRLFGGNGNDALTADDGVDLLDGGEGNDTLNGNAGNDRLTGGEGNDTIVGGTGGDSMVGGPGVDVFTGGDGVDYCVRESGENGTSCFFDNAKPKILGLSTSTDSVELVEGDESASVNIFVQLSDAGVGVDADRAGISLFWDSVRLAGGDRGSFSHQPCVLAEGDIWQGTWVCAVVVSSETLGGQNGRLFSLSAGDDVGNRSVRVFERTFFTISNDQFGGREQVRPAITDFTVTTSARTFDVTSSPKFVEGQFRAADASGVYRVDLGPLSSRWHQWLCDASSFSELSDELKENAVASIQTDAPAYDSRVPDIINHIRTAGGGGGYLCRVSGNPESGLYKFIYEVSRFPPKSAIQLTAQALDYSGNASRSNPAVDITVVNTLVNFADSTAPTMNSIAVTPTVINTSTSSAIVTIRANFRDAGNGFDYASLEFTRAATATRSASSFAVLVRYERCQVSGDLRSAATPTAGVNITPSTSCLLSGDHRNGAFEAKVLIPANFPNGTFTLDFVRMFDNSTGNMADWDKKKLSQMGLAVSIRNG